MSRVHDASWIGNPENPTVLPLEDVFEVAGQTIVLPDESARLDVIPPVWLHFASDVALMAPGASRTVEVEVTAARADTSGKLRLETLADWKVSPAEQPFHLANVAIMRLQFTIAAPSKTGRGESDSQRGSQWRAVQ